MLFPLARPKSSSTPECPSWLPRQIHTSPWNMDLSENKWWYPKMVDLKGKILLKLMFWGNPYFRKPPYAVLWINPEPDADHTNIDRYLHLKRHLSMSCHGKPSPACSSWMLMELSMPLHGMNDCKSQKAFEKLNLQSFRVAWKCGSSELSGCISPYNKQLGPHVPTDFTIVIASRIETGLHQVKMACGSSRSSRPQKQNPSEPNTGKVPLWSSARQDMLPGNSSWTLGNCKISSCFDLTGKLSCYHWESWMHIYIITHVCMYIYIYNHICIYVYTQYME